ncbi:hypothetical protein ACKUU1_23555 [Mycobacterium seoulense]|uniref:hypothetical protein n=1 Tax=Mycobacterium seoulense TaxID=386911 RepID=UPI003CF2355A
MRPHKLVAAAGTFAAALLTSTSGMPQAFASESGDLWNMINDAHVAAGCHKYDNAAPLAAVALHLAQAMVANNGAKNAPGGFAPTTENLLNQQGYFPTSIGEMDNWDNVDPRNIQSVAPYNGRPPAGSIKDQVAMEFWQSHETKALFPNCGMQQMEVAVWENGNKWAAVALMATPGPTPGPLPPQNQPH